MSAIERGRRGYHHPATEEELQQLVRKAYEQRRQLRVRGSAHSVAQSIYTDGYAGEGEPPGAAIDVMLDQYRNVTITPDPGDPTHATVEVEGGCNLGKDPYDGSASTPTRRRSRSTPVLGAPEGLRLPAPLGQIPASAGLLPREPAQAAGVPRAARGGSSGAAALRVCRSAAAISFTQRTLMMTLGRYGSAPAPAPATGSEGDIDRLSRAYNVRVIPYTDHDEVRLFLTALGAHG